MTNTPHDEPAPQESGPAASLSDLGKYLPLSPRVAVDESAVTGDWHPSIASGLQQIASVLEALTPSQWQQESLCSGWQVRDVAGHLVWRIGSSGGALARDGIGSLLAGRLTLDGIVDRPSRRAALAPSEALVSRLREIAAQHERGEGRKGVNELAEVMIHGLDIAIPLGVALPFTPIESGAVALARAAAAPSGLRSLLNERTLSPTDATWRVGSGPALVDSSEGILLLLYGRKAATAA